MAELIRSAPIPLIPLPVDGVIFLADMIDIAVHSVNNTETFAERRDLEKTAPGTRDEVLAALAVAGYDAIHMQEPTEMLENVDLAKRHVVLSTYGGEIHRSRTSWAPVVCEMYGIPYVGLDGYGQSKCHSKMSAKDLAKHSGLITPRAREYHSLDDLRHLDDWTFPVIVKPSAEGSSIGINAASVVRSVEGIRNVAATLFASIDASIMVEEFVTGREVSLAAIEGPNGTYMSLNEVVVKGQPDYFASRVWGAHEKFFNERPREIVSIDDELCKQDRQALGRFLTALGHFGYIRIDGRLHDGRFHFLEATPDAWLGQGGQLVQGFVNDGWTYDQVIAAIIETARARLPNPTATD